MKNVERRVTTSLCLNYDEDLKYIVNPDGTLIQQWNPVWMERYYDYLTYFQSILVDPIRKAIGEKGWHVHMLQSSVEDCSFFADISTNNLDTYPIIANIVDGLIPRDFKISFFLIPKHFNPEGDLV